MGLLFFGGFTANKLIWFTHDHNAHDDPFIQELMDRFNHFGYAAYFIILELLHKDGIGDVLVVSPSRLCQKLRSRQSRVRELLDFCRTSGKVESEWKQYEVRLQINKFRERQSNLKSKLISRPFKDHSNLILEEKRIDEIRKEENKQITDRTARITFQPPNIEDVRSYCLERNNRVDPQRWIDHYTSNGWKVGKNQMKDWRAAVRTWEKNDGFNSKGSGESNIRTQPVAGKYAGLEREV